MSTDPRPASGEPASATTPVGRRIVLGMLGLGAVGVALGAPVASLAGRLLDPVRRNDPTGLTDLVPGDGWRYYSVTSQQPSVGTAAFRLRLGGLVERPAEYTYADLDESLPSASVTADFQCVTGWRVADVPWSGVLLRDLLLAARVRPEAGAVTFRSLDGTYTESLTLEQALRSDVLVATRMYGETVTGDHGGPVRLYVAPMYGYKSLKWLAAIDLVAEVEPGYWEQRGYDVDAYVGRSNGRSDEPV